MEECSRGHRGTLWWLLEGSIIFSCTYSAVIVSIRHPFRDWVGIGGGGAPFIPGTQESGSCYTNL